ncbi:MAG: CBS domain-containing protein [Cypionkella sp.]|nr:CBS domain-containing protein [Cypionkella sp.]
MDDLPALIGFLESVHPYDSLPHDELARVASLFRRSDLPAETLIYTIGATLEGLYLIQSGEISILDASGAQVSALGPRNSFGERGLLRDGLAASSAQTVTPTTLLMLPAASFRNLIADNPAFDRFFNRGRSADTRNAELAVQTVGELMSRHPLTCPPDATAQTAAIQMRDAHISSLGVVEAGKFIGIITTRDLTGRVLADGLPADTPIAQVMTANPISLPPQALGSDVLQLMLEKGIGHLPVVENGRLMGMVTQTDITRYQATSSAQLMQDLVQADTAAAMALVTRRIPQLLVQLVGSNTAHQVTTRLITDIADTVTRRLLTLAKTQLGVAPVRYLWLACGSQGRQEQTGVSDQDNCLIIDDTATAADMEYFAALAKFVSDGLDHCGYFYCPGNMMATNPQWCQRLITWQGYFHKWIATPDPMAQMLASVMFDLRPIGGDSSLFTALQTETLENAAANSIFVAHMVANSLTHTPPLGLLRGFATFWSGEHKNQIDLKHNGVVPVTDLGRVYALIGKLPAANTRARLQGADGSGVISPSGARDLIDAYDMIAETRLEHQARQIRSGAKPTNFMAPSDLSDFDRTNLRDAFVVVRTMQSAVGSARGART